MFGTHWDHAWYMINIEDVYHAYLNYRKNIVMQHYLYQWLVKCHNGTDTQQSNHICIPLIISLGKQNEEQCRHRFFRIYTAQHLGPLLLLRVNLAWISNYIHLKVWDEMTYPFPNFNGSRWSLWMDKSFHFIPHFTGHLITSPCWFQS